MNKRININGEEFVILTSINLDKTAFLICIDAFDKKIKYFVQQNVEGKVKLISSNNIEQIATMVNKKSLSNKKRILDAFCKLVEEKLANSVFIDHDKVSSSFKELVRQIDACDLKYYIIENASIEETDDSINNLLTKFSEINFNKNLEQVTEVNNELYYFNNSPVSGAEPKAEEVVNQNIIDVANNTNDINNETSGPMLANDILSNVNIDEMISNNFVNIPINEEPKKIDEGIIKKNKKTKNIMTIISLLLLIGIGVAYYFIFFNNEETKKTNDDIVNRLLNTTTINESDKGVAYNKPTRTLENYSYYMNLNLMDIDFSNLIKENSDTIGWIKIDSLNINYPIVKAKENNYYQKHNYDKETSNTGWIYLDENSSLSVLGKNTVIYGKAASDNSLFGNLGNTLTEDWFKNYKNYIIMISSPEANTMWQIFSVYEIPNEDYYLKTEFSDDEYTKFLDDIVKRSTKNFSVQLNENDKLLTLSTNKDNENRIVVHAKLIKIEEKSE